MTSDTPDPAEVRIAGPWQHRDVYANGIRLHLAEAGSGPLVLLLHGFAGFWWSWSRCVPRLVEKGYRVAAVDLRGYGDSDKPPRGYDAWTLSADVAGLIRSLGVRQAHLVGHGLGGGLAWSTATLHSRMIASISVLGAAHPLALRSAVLRTVFRRRRSNQALAIAELLRAQPPLAGERRLTERRAEDVRRLLRDRAAPGWAHTTDFAEVAERHREAMLIKGVAHSALEYYRWAFRSQFRGDGKRFADALSVGVELPVLQLHGLGDPCVFPETARASTPWAGVGSRFQGLAGIGHLPHLEDPETTVRQIHAFLREY